jgi:hypothetical protein
MCGLPANFGANGRQLISSWIVEAELLRPPVSVLAAIAPWHSAGAPHRKIDLLATKIELLGDLSPGLGATYDQHGAGNELSRIAIGIRVNLPDVRRQCRAKLGYLGRLIETRCDHDVASGDAAAIAGAEPIKASALVSVDAFNANAIADRQMELLNVALKVGNDLAPRHEPVQVGTIVFDPREPGLPVRCVERERIPTMIAPSFGHPIRLLEDKMIAALP